MREPILVLNARSSSVKFSVFETSTEPSLSAGPHGQVQGIGASGRLSIADRAGRKLAEQRVTSRQNFPRIGSSSPILATAPAVRGQPRPQPRHHHGLHRDRRIADGHALRCLGEEPDPRDLMRPFPADLMRMWPVSPEISPRTILQSLNGSNWRPAGELATPDVRRLAVPTDAPAHSASTLDRGISPIAPRLRGMPGTNVTLLLPEGRRPHKSWFAASASRRSASFRNRHLRASIAASFQVGL